MSLAAIFVVLVFLYSLVSRRLEQTVVTAPIAFTTAGILLPLVLPGLREQLVGREVFLHLAEVGLVLLLFTDASRTDLRVLKDIRALPARLLSTGLLLTIVLGALAARLVFPNLSLWEAGALGAILAPTDAGLGQVVVNSPRLPLKIRQALNVEAGLNDGLSVPFLLFFVALAVGGATGEGASLRRFIGEQLGYGALVGVVVGGLGGWLLGVAQRREWLADSWRQLGVVALPVLCVLASEAVGASMFIAAFVAGLTVQRGFTNVGKHSVEFTEGWGQLFNLAIFLLFGMFVAEAWTRFNAWHALYAVLSLTLVRLLPVAIALIGTRLCRATVLFIGWFGPRGLASIVLGLVYLEQETQQPGEATIRLAVMMTVLVSIFAHGLSAMPGMEFYVRRISNLPTDAPEWEGESTTLRGSPGAVIS